MGAGADPNSPEVFRQNLQVVQQELMQVQSLARNALVGIQSAYHLGTNPTQTEVDLANLKQSINFLLNLMRHTGVGALPLLPLPTEAVPTMTVPTEEQLMEDTTRGIKVLFEKQKRSQESANVAANILGSSGAIAALGPTSSMSELSSKGAR
ncbi:hypothetical protein AMATHDRAFT_158262 [Amanita thiersii Skay4041]|uniref:Uncharacterized protein n=1 Tax=Amanita thiersii Skay4041 TaxID=703135 RepID=A0A2A9NBN8_9AGAR|nr:hypothetical protein AMATHDRAFT_158262 [Amanita thiersii Skay4041]